MSYFWVKACRRITKYSTIQKLDWSFSAASFATSLKPHPLQDGSNYKRWHALSLLWFIIMHYEHVIKGKCAESAFSAEEESMFNEANN
jgi:hypothetical protein